MAEQIATEIVGEVRGPAHALEVGVRGERVIASAVIYVAAESWVTVGLPPMDARMARELARHLEAAAAWADTEPPSPEGPVGPVTRTADGPVTKTAAKGTVGSIPTVSR